MVRLVCQVVGHCPRAAVDVVGQVPRRPGAVCHVHKQRGLAEYVEVVVGSRRAGENVVDVQVVVADRLQYDGPALLAGDVLTSKGLGTPPPLPVGAVQGANAPRHSPSGAALHDGLELRGGRLPQVLDLVLGDQNVEQLLDADLNSRLGQTHILVGSVIGLTECEDTEGGHELLQRVGLWPPCRVDRLAPKRPLLDVIVDPQENDTGHTEAALKRCLVVDGLIAVEAEVVGHDAAHAALEISRPVGAATWHGADVGAAPIRAAAAQTHRRGDTHRPRREHDSHGLVGRLVVGRGGLLVRRGIGAGRR